MFRAFISKLRRHAHWWRLVVCWEETRDKIREYLAERRHRRILQGQIQGEANYGSWEDNCPACGAGIIETGHWHIYTDDYDLGFPPPPDSDCPGDVITINYQYECGYKAHGVWPGLRAWIEKHGLDWADFEEEYGFKEGEVNYWNA